MTDSKKGAGGMAGAGTLSERDKPWIFRTYAGHSTAAKSNELYRKNLSKGQTGLSIAFDLPTQTGYDSDAFCCIGIHGQWLYVDPLHEVTIVKLSSQPTPADDALDQHCLAFIRAVAREI